MNNPEQYPAILSFDVIAKNPTPMQKTRHLPNRFKGEYLRNAEVQCVIGSFGRFLHQQVIDTFSTIHLISVSLNEPVTINMVNDKPATIICCVLRGSFQSKLPGNGKILLPKNRYTFSCIPPNNNIPLEFDAGENQVLYFSLSNNLLACIVDQHPLFLKLIAAQRDKPASSMGMPIFRIGVEERKILNAVLKCTLENSKKHLFVCARILDLIVSYLLSLEMAESISSHSHNHHTRILESQQYIQENYFIPIRIGFLCKRAGINLRTYERIFKELFGIGPREYIEQVRAKKAAELLQTTTLPITSIGHSVGFTGSNYFSFVFRKVHGCSPREYRKDRMQHTNCSN